MKTYVNSKTDIKKNHHNSYHHGDLKSSLVSAALKILKENGVGALSLRAIAAEVGVSHMAPYAHFKNKKMLLQSIAATGFKELAIRMVDASKSLIKPNELILSYGATYIEFAVENPELYRLMLGQVETSGRRQNSKQKGVNKNLIKPELSLEMETNSKRPFELLHSAFKQIKQKQKNTIAQALGAWSMVHGMAALIIEGHIEIPESMSIKDFLEQAAIQPE